MKKKRARRVVRKKKVSHKKVKKRAARRKFGLVKKSSKEPRVVSGIPNFDEMIGGGFEKDSTNLVVGGSGGGKTIFATQFLVEGMKKGETCLYITFEEKKEQFYKNMADFGWDLAEFERKGLFSFLEYSPIKVKTMLEEGGGAIESIILKKKVSRVVIDSITSFALLFEDELARREAALSLFGMIKGWEATALLTLEEEPTPAGEVSSEAMKFEADSIVVLYYARKGSRRGRFIEVIKMRGTKHSDKVYPFEIGKGGVNIGKSPVQSFFGR